MKPGVSVLILHLKNCQTIITNIGIFYSKNTITFVHKNVMLVFKTSSNSLPKNGKNHQE
jgi:hypothetical protein